MDMKFAVGALTTKIVIGAVAACAASVVVWQVSTDSGQKTANELPSSGAQTSAPVTFPPPTGPQLPPCAPTDPGATDPGAGYPGSIYAVSRLRLDTTSVEAGEQNTATVRLRTQDPNTLLRGRTILTIQPASGGPAVRLDRRLSKGLTEFDVPQNLANGDYNVQATYIPRCGDSVATQTETEDLTITGR